MNCVEMALCDIAGKALKTPAYNLLCGKFRDKVRVYLDRSSPPEVEKDDSWKRMAKAAVDAGFTQMKFDIDYIAAAVPDVWNRCLSTRQINLITHRMGLVHKTVGADCELCVDCHRVYNVPDAIRVANALAPFNLLWLEDPTPHTNPDSTANVKAKSPIPICIGEMFTIDEFRLFIDHDAIDILHPDILFCGGMHEMKRISDYGDVHHLPTAMHRNGGDWRPSPPRRPPPPGATFSASSTLHRDTLAQ